MDIIVCYEGKFNLKNKTIKFKMDSNFKSLKLDDGRELVYNENSTRYGNIKFRNHVMEHVYNIMINKNYNLKRQKFIYKIYSLYSIDSSWGNVEIIKMENEFIYNNFNSEIYKSYTSLIDIYKKRFYILCYLYVHGGVFIGNSCIKLNYPLEYFVKKSFVLVKNNLNGCIYDDFMIAPKNNKFMLNLITAMSTYIINKNYKLSYDLMLGCDLYKKIVSEMDYSLIKKNKEVQFLNFDSYLRTDIQKNCNYCWINEKNNKERYIEMEATKYLKLQTLHKHNWTVKKIIS